VPSLTAGPTSLRVDRGHGGRLASLVVHGHELLVQPPRDRRADPMLWGCFPMVPFAGRLRGGRFRWGGELHQLPTNHAGHAMHGTLFDQRWLIEAADDGYLRLCAQLRDPWPFPGHVIHELSLAPDSIELRLEVHAEGPPFPATAGWHPWFRRRLEVGGRLTVELDAGRFYPRGADGLPLGTLTDPPSTGPWDDCFTAITWPATLTWPGALEVSMTSTASHAVLYDQQHHAICLEPQTGPPDAANLGVARIVRRHDPLVVEMALTWQLL
jgi:galactose mutarotase-like enzyme